MPETPVSPIPATPASEEQKSWHEYLRATKQAEPSRLEEAAKFLAGMVSITFTILLSANENSLTGKTGWQAVAVLLWLLSLLLAFGVLYPQPYRTHKGSSQKIEEMHDQIVRRKSLLLAGAVLTFLLGFLILTGIYLGNLF